MNTPDEQQSKIIGVRWTKTQVATLDKLMKKTSLNRTGVIKLAVAEMAERRLEQKEKPEA